MDRDAGQHGGNLWQPGKKKGREAQNSDVMNDSHALLGARIVFNV